MRIQILTALFFVLLPLSAHAAADNFIYPVSIWNVTTHQGDYQSDGSYHMGVDIGYELGAGAEVHATADGVVKEARTRSDFGLVVLIEHTLPDGSKVVSQYGHLRPSDVRVSPGQNVYAGDVVGVLGDTWENGNWPPHLHFGIHKGAYSSVWIYYGHVPNASSANNWYDPETFVPDHLVRDTWMPTVNISIPQPNALVASVADVMVYATDLGSGVETVRVRLSDDGEQSWTTAREYSGRARYPYRLPVHVDDLGDGSISLRIVVIDAFGNKTKQTVKLQKKGDAAYTRHVSAISGSGRKTGVYTTYQTGEVSEHFIPFADTWTDGGDIAVGYVKGQDESPHVVTVKNSVTSPVVKVSTRGGSELDSFSAFDERMTSSARIALGDLDGNGVDELIVGSGAGISARVRVFDRHGTVLNEFAPFAQDRTSGVDVAAGDVDGDGNDEIIVGARNGSKSTIVVLESDGARLDVFRAFKKTYKGGVNVTAGDVNGDGLDDIIVGSNGDRTGRVSVFGPHGKRKDIFYIPFGDTFTGAVDVSTTDWEDDGTDEIMMSTASDGEAWVKTYRYDDAKTLIVQDRVFEEGFTGGARISGW